MRGMLSLVFSLLLMFLMFLAVPALRGAEIKVYILTDGEGPAGIQSFAQVDPDNPELKKQLAEEINAAVEGLLEAGATEILVWDGHDGSRTLRLGDLHPRARLLQGVPVPRSFGLDSGFAALLFVGQHAMAGAPGILAHSYSSEGIQNMWMNGKLVGEIGTRAAYAGWLNVPVIFLSGDRAACEELLELVPNAEVAIVKEALSRTAALSLSRAAALDLIRRKARAALQRRAEIQPYRIAGPVEFRIEYTTRHPVRLHVEHNPGVTKINERTVAIRGKDFLEAWNNAKGFSEGFSQ